MTPSVRKKKDTWLFMGNEAIAESAVRAGCRHYFGYPITPQSELLEYMARRLPEVGGVFLQAESELAAISMVYGASGAGARVMTSSSGLGISLMSEGISYIVGSELPCVIVNMMRGGPGLGNISPAQADYFQATRGPGHGDHRLVVLAPASVQEAADLTFEAFDIADRYRNPVMILGDSLLGQVMEPVTFREMQEPGTLPEKPWATTGSGYHKGRNVINSLRLDPEALWSFNRHLEGKHAEMARNEVRWAGECLEDAEIVVVAYGIMARICQTAVAQARQEGIAAGLIRPVSLWPFPKEPFEVVMDSARRFLVVEMSLGQMLEDVSLTVQGRRPVHFLGKTGGVVPTQKEVLAAINAITGKDLLGVAG